MLAALEGLESERVQLARDGEDDSARKREGSLLHHPPCY